MTAPGGGKEGQKEMATILKEIKDGEVNTEKVTLSSDGNGSFPKFDESGNLADVGRGKVTTMWGTIRESVRAGLLDLREGLKFVSTNPARRIGVAERKGKVAPGYDADLVVVDSGLEIDTVYGKGKILLEEGEKLVTGYFE